MDVREVTTQDSVLLDPEQISESPGPFCMSFGFDLRSLIRSIEKFGLINRPIVANERKGRVQVVAGYRRILALKQLQWKEIPCRDLSDAGLSSLQCLLLNLHDNLATRSFNEVEKGMILNRLVQHVSRDEILRDFMPLLDLPRHEATLEIFLDLEKLQKPIKESLVHARISFQTAKALVHMDPEFRLVLFKWMVGLGLNTNQQSQFIAYTTDIAIRDQKKISELMKENKILEILSNKKLNKPQKTKLLLDFLRSRRFPRLTRSEKAFKEKAARLGLPDGIHIYHPPFFEDPDYRLEILFRNGKHLRKKIDALVNVRGLESLGDPWEEEEV